MFYPILAVTRVIHVIAGPNDPAIVVNQTIENLEK